MNRLKEHYDAIIFLSLVLVIATAAVYRTTLLYPESATGAVTAEFNYMDRHALSDNLVYIFGHQARPIVAENLFEMGAPLGGGCDFYKMTYDSNQKVLDPFWRCPAGTRDINAPMFVKPNAIRNAAINKSCRLLTENPETLKHALGLVNIPENAEVNQTRLADLYFAFHRAPPEGRARDEWQPGKVSGWQEAVYKMCASPDWQVL